ncbi:MAG: S-adenosylmethionine:tRNA ribosyltransferase-isomerase [Acidimicrobiales bacterium]
MATVQLPGRVLDIEVPDARIADRPIEAEGARRDDVRMLVAHRGTSALTHARARDLPSHLDPGDVLVVNTSPTLPAAVPSYDRTLVIHFSTDLGSGRWVVEVREPCGLGSRPHPVDHGQAIPLAGGAVVRLRRPHSPPVDGASRLWEADLLTPVPLSAWLTGEGRPIRYGCATTAWPIDAYQTIFASAGVPGLGSAEMPSAARPFTAELVAALIAAGVVLAPITLHTGVSSLEDHEPPYAERYRVPAETARLVNQAHDAGHRVIAVGTTATRALETDARAGLAHEGDGWTELVITPERGLEVVDGIISGWHEPEASHLLLMEAVAGRPLLEASYAAALAQGYRWHEFGDIHLVLP